MDAFAFEAIGTHWKIDVRDEISAPRRAEIFDAVARRIATFDRDYSRFRDDSLVAAMAREAGTYELPADAEPMLKLYQTLYELTDGAVTPLIGQVLIDAGYDATYSLKPGKLRRPPSWDEAIDYRPPTTLTMKKPAMLDFGALGKGLLVDIVGEVLAAHGLRSYCVDAGGDMLHRDPSGAPLRVGLEHPLEVGRAFGVVTLPSGMSLCGSAGNRRAWDRFHHVIDPRSLESPRHILAAWALAGSTMLADAMTTGMYFMDPARLKPYFAFEHLVILGDGAVERSPGFPVELFTA
jgi:thiamine biosynthesis lipoprotein